MATDLADRPLTALKGVGPKLAEKLARLRLHTLQDLLFHLPLRYQDRTRVTAIGATRAGMETTIEGTVELADVVYRGRRSLLCRVTDGTGALHLRFFYFSGAQQVQFVRGTRIRCFGEVRFGPTGREMAHPEYTLGETLSALPDRLTPVYPTTEGLTQTRLRQLIALALREARTGLAELLPEVKDAFSLHAALEYVHTPPADAARAELAQGLHPAQRRLAFEELLAQHLSLRRQRLRTRALRAPALPGNGELRAKLRRALPYPLTSAQVRVCSEIERDLHQATPMQRLVQGDVGSGKTVVAALAMLQAVESGRQAALMAPTELLGEQHARTLADWLTPLGVRVAWLAGKLKAPARAQALNAIASGEAQVVVGTHALFQSEVRFQPLGLIVVDEQHRFGVQQRLALRGKGGDAQTEFPHQLVMSATPIPRTLAQTFYVDLDVSTIDELPPGRTPVETVALSDARRPDVTARVRAACKEGRQAYWVCALIEESAELQLQTATDTARELTAALPEVRVALVHGRLKPAEKERTMAAFKNREIDLLVATTVIEVGVDVPNASLMIIENAERLGLAQLHQLRGRVGRGAKASACVLMYRAPLSETAQARLACLRETNDGFEIARRDLEMRGPGEMFGLRQTGLAQMRIADLVRDQGLMPQVTQIADAWLAHNDARIEPLIRRWLGGAAQYGEV